MSRITKGFLQLPSISPCGLSGHRSLPVNVFRALSTSRSCRIMELIGFSQEQLDVREAVARICSKFPAGRYESAVYPHDLHAALARDGWKGIALPEDLGGAGLGISEATMMLQTISQSATQPVAKFAKEDQRKSMLPRLISGEWKAYFKVTEPRSGE